MSDDPSAAPRPRSTWVARALLAVAVVFLLENAKPLIGPCQSAGPCGRLLHHHRPMLSAAISSASTSALNSA